MTLSVEIENDGIKVGNYFVKKPHTPVDHNWLAIVAEIVGANKGARMVEVDALRSDYKTKTYDLWVKPHIKEILVSCRSSIPGELDQAKLANYWVGKADSKNNETKSKNKTPLNTIPKNVVIHPGEEHLIPIMNAFDETQLGVIKKRVGKSLWKTLCKNDTELNTLLMEIHRHSELEDPESAKKLLQILSKLPQEQVEEFIKPSLLERLKDGSIEVPDVEYALTHFKKINNGEEVTAKGLRDVLLVMSDIGDMSEEYYKVRKLARNKPPELIHSSHDDLIELSKKVEDLSDINFGALVSFEKQIDLPGGTAFLLDSAKKLRTEGNVMNHCIGGYAQRFRSGKYAAYHLKSNKGKHSTLGLFLVDYTPSGVDQNKGPGNDRPHQSCRELASEVVSYLHSTLGHANESSKREKALIALAKRDGANARTSIEERMSEFNKAKEKGDNLSMSEFVKPDLEIDGQPSDSDERLDHSTQGLASFVDNMLEH